MTAPLDTWHECQLPACRSLRKDYAEIVAKLGYGDPFRRIEELRGKATPRARCDACSEERCREYERAKEVANNGKLPKAIRDAALRWMQGGGDE